VLHYYIEILFLNPDSLLLILRLFVNAKPILSIFVTNVHSP